MGALRNVKTLTKRELAEYFVSPAAYVFIVIFLALCGFFTFMISNFFKGNEASLATFFIWLPWLYLFLVPAVGMHLWSDERRLGTLELLFTLPLTVFQAILSKFLAAWLFVGLALLLTFPVPFTALYLGDPDLGAIVSGYIGAFLLAGGYLAVVSMTSALTRSQVVSFIVAVVICLFFILAGWPPVTDMLVEWAPRGVVEAVAACSFMTHFDSIQRGVLDSRDLVYFGSVIVFFLSLTGIILKNHRAG